MSKKPQTRVVVRSSRTSVVILLLAAAAIAALVLGWFRCGGAGWLGGGGTGTASGDGSAAAGTSAAAAASSAPPATPAGPCALRLDATGLTLDGRVVTQAQALAACKPAGEAILHVVGDTPFGAFERLRDELERGGVRVTTRSPRAAASAASAPTATASTATP